MQLFRGDFALDDGGALERGTYEIDGQMIRFSFPSCRIACRWSVRTFELRLEVVECGDQEVLTAGPRRLEG